MVKIVKEINGKEVEIVLTEKELEDVQKQVNIQWAKDVLANYEEMIDYETIVQDEAKLLAFAERLEVRMFENNGELELEVLHELFDVREE
jgi:iron only hydrogenase large subunit-like protein